MRIWETWGHAVQADSAKAEPNTLTDLGQLYKQTGESNVRTEDSEGSAQTEADLAPARDSHEAGA
jgi:hypothetical protein